MEHVKLSFPNGIGADGSVVINGQPTNAVTAVKFEARADSFATLTVETLAQAFEWDGPAAVQVAEETRDLLIKLGWTPPAE